MPNPPITGAAVLNAINTIRVSATSKTSWKVPALHL
jgi:hypothetical protein